MDDFARELAGLRAYGSMLVANGLGATRRWSEFFERFNIPANWASLERRVYTNLLYYTTNYLIVAVLVLLWSMVTRWALLFSTTVSCAVWVYALGVYNGHFSLAGRRLAPAERSYALIGAGGLTAFVLWLTGTILATLLVAAIAVAIVFLHAVLRPPNTHSNVNKLATDVRLRLGGWGAAAGAGGGAGGSSGGRKKRAGGGAHDSDAASSEDEAARGTGSDTGITPASLGSFKHVFQALMGNPQRADGSPLYGASGPAGFSAAAAVLPGGGRRRDGGGVGGAAGDVEGSAAGAPLGSSIPAFAGSSHAAPGLVPVPPYPAGVGSGSSSTAGAVSSPFAHPPAFQRGAGGGLDHHDDGAAQWQDVGLSPVGTGPAAAAAAAGGATTLFHRKAGGGGGDVLPANLPRPH